MPAIAGRFAHPAIPPNLENGLCGSGSAAFLQRGVFQFGGYWGIPFHSQPTLERITLDISSNNAGKNRFYNFKREPYNHIKQSRAGILWPTRLNLLST